MLRVNLEWLLALLFPFLSGCAVLVAAGVVSGVGVGAAVSQDRRTSDMFIGDEAIELKGGQRISERMGRNVNVSVASFNRIVLLTDEAPFGSLKSEIERLVMGVRNVREVTNEIVVGKISSYASRSNDAFLTSKVKARFLDGGEFCINHGKVVTENSVVFLLGLVKVKEADSAVDIARSLVSRWW